MHCKRLSLNSPENLLCNPLVLTSPEKRLCNFAVLLFQRIEILPAEPYWGTPDNTPPPDTPQCGFRNDLCPMDNTSKTYICLWIILLHSELFQIMTGLIRIWEQLEPKMLHDRFDVPIWLYFLQITTKMPHYGHDFDPNPSITSHILK